MIAGAVARRMLKTAAVGALAVAAPRLWTHAPLMQRYPLSTGVWSADGELLRVTRAPDDQYRLWVPLERISPALADGVAVPVVHEAVPFANAAETQRILAARENVGKVVLVH